MNKIKDIRALTGLSQAKFAEKYHIKKRTLENWESQHCSTEPPEHYVFAIEQLVNNDYKNGDNNEENN